jgi:uncharacterized protein (DUF433 family)
MQPKRAPGFELNPEILGGCAVFANTRIPVETVLASMARGLSDRELHRAYPGLSAEQLVQAREWQRTPRVRVLRPPALQSWFERSRQLLRAAKKIG